MALMKCIKTVAYCVLFLGSSCLLIASEGDEYESRPLEDIQVESTQKESFSGILKPFALVGVAVAVGGACAMSETLRHTLRSSYGKLEELLKHKIAPGMLMKIEKIRDEGLEKKDIMKLVGVVGMCVSIKKLADFFHLEQLIRGDSSSTRKALEYCRKEYKKILAAMGVTSLLCYIAWRSSQEAHIFDKLQLTAEQQDYCSHSKELSALIESKDYSSFLIHRALVSLLNDHQRALSQSLIKEYEDECVLQLLEGIDG